MIWIEDLVQYKGKEVELKGWVYNKRSSGGVRFVLLRDGTGIVQVTYSNKDTDKKSFELADTVSQESLVKVKGIVREDSRAPGGIELLGKELKLLSPSYNYPITKKSHGVDFLLSNRHLWLRSRKQHAILKIRSEIVKAGREFFDSRGFLLIDSPILTPTSCEGTTTLFEVKYFDNKVYLSQSGQLYLEPAAAAFGRVYCFGPTFRAEKSKTRRHLMEFWQLEPEVAFLDLKGVIKLAEELVTYIVEKVLEKRKNELKILERDISKLECIKPPFPRITYKDAIKILNQNNNPTKYGEDFGGDEETILSNKFDKPVIISHYPREIKPFYMKEDPDDPNLVLNFDMLAPEGYGEIIGGSEREDNLEKLLKRIEELKLPKEPLEWYLDIRRYGSFPHSGFGLGLERTVAWICKIPHLRETIPYPRLLDRIYP